MKKSEMISVIAGIIEVNKELTSGEVARLVLDEVLSRGMLPPEANVLVMREFGPGLDVKFYDKKRVWENEGDVL